MTEPNGFWESGTAGQEEFDEDLMNACLIQLDTKVNLDLLTDRAGMFAHSSDDKRFWRSDGADLINLAVIEFGTDAAKPAASAANNGRVFWATDTLTLYIVLNATQYLVSDQNVVVDHVGEGDPHVQYQKESEKSAVNGYASLDGSTLVPQAELPDHADRHPKGGADEIDGDIIDIDFTPSVYTPNTAPAEVTDVDELTSHLKGIDDQFAITGVKKETFTGSGTYTKPANALLLRVLSVAGGGGGAGGGTIDEAGGGGGAGELLDVMLNAADVPASPAVTIGAGGLGGAANLDGNNGGDTSLGTVIVAGGGGGGQDGTSTQGGKGGKSGSNIGSGPDDGPAAEFLAAPGVEHTPSVLNGDGISGGGGGQGDNSGKNPQIGGKGYKGPGGGGGGGQESIDDPGAAGGIGGAMIDGGVAGGVAGAGAGGAGGAGVAGVNDLGGGGGGGGGGNNGGNGGVGGLGGTPGAGGGGGGQATGTPGSGGNGAIGQMIIYTYLGELS